MGTIYLKDFETLTYQQAVEMVPEWLAQLEHGGVLEFTCLDFAYVVRLYSMDPDSLPRMSALLFDEGRCALWNEVGIARMLLTNGFTKVWTGHTEEDPEHTFRVKAMKLSEVNHNKEEQS